MVEVLVAAFAGLWGAMPGLTPSAVPTVVLGVGTLLLAPGASLGEAPRPAPIVTTLHFAFHSDFETNLNDALIAAGLARKGGKPELFRSGAEASCFGTLPRSARSAWDRAVDYYAEVISAARWSDREQFLVRAQLAGFAEEVKDAGDRQFVEIARSFRAAATPAYDACRWPAQDEKNRRWIADLGPRLAAGEDTIAARLEQLYRKRWSGLPIRVDVVETVDWSGANSIFRELGGGHALISNANQGPAAFEVVFHEASHLLMGRADPLRQALESAAGAAGYRLPGDLWHVVLFYTTGEAVRRVLDEGGASAYTPMLYAIFDRGTWVGYRKALESAWRPYVEGARALDAAAAGLVEALRAPQPAPPQRERRE